VNSFWTLISECEETHSIDFVRCRQIIDQNDTIAGVRSYLDSVLSRLEEGDRGAISEAWSVAVPLAYRLAIDDTANGYRIASRLKEAAMWAAYPEILSCVGDEIEWLCKSACGTGYSELRNVQKDICDKLTTFSRSLNGQWRVYGRRKSISSVMAKLAKLNSGNKLPKNTSPEVLHRMNGLLVQFQEQVSQRMAGYHCQKRPYEFSDVKWLLPDLLAFTLQLTEKSDSNRNLGSAKARYISVYRKLCEQFPARVFFGPSYSRAWHMNRMVCHLEYPVAASSCVAIELFVRTDFDYFVGYGNYWRYKGVDLFAPSSRENKTSRQQFIRRVRECRSFSDVQEMLLKEITTGQISII
jgi:hypothetical protein